jgi:hypothetical protein
MKNDLQQKIIDAGPVLYGACRISPNKKTSWRIDCPDDLFGILLGLTTQIESYNQRHKKSYVLAMKVAMEDGKLIFMTQRKVSCVEKWIGQSRLRIRRHRMPIREDLLMRARNMQSTALFASRLIPDWKRLMPDELQTLRKILCYAERCAVSRGDWILLSRWFSSILEDAENAVRCLQNSEMSE